MIHNCKGSSGTRRRKCKTLYEMLDEEGRSVFENARQTVIREMEAITELDVQSCIVSLIDAEAQISVMQKFAVLEIDRIAEKLVSYRKKGLGGEKHGV